MKKLRVIKLVLLISSICFLFQPIMARSYYRQITTSKQFDDVVANKKTLLMIGKNEKNECFSITTVTKDIKSDNWYSNITLEGAQIGQFSDVVYVDDDSPVAELSVTKTQSYFLMKDNKSSKYLSLTSKTANQGYYSYRLEFTSNIAEANYFNYNFYETEGSIKICLYKNQYCWVEYNSLLNLFEARVDANENFRDIYLYEKIELSETTVDSLSKISELNVTNSAELNNITFDCNLYIIAQFGDILVITDNKETNDCVLLHIDNCPENKYMIGENLLPGLKCYVSKKTNGGYQFFLPGFDESQESKTNDPNCFLPETNDDLVGLIQPIDIRPFEMDKVAMLNMLKYVSMPYVYYDHENNKLIDPIPSDEQDALSVEENNPVTVPVDNKFGVKIPEESGYYKFVGLLKNEENKVCFIPIKVDTMVGVNNLESNKNDEMKIFDMNGIEIDNLKNADRGIYIIKSRSNSKKVLVK